MKIVSYRPADDQFWIACSKREAEQWFVPRLDERGQADYQYAVTFRDGMNSVWRAEYEEMVKQTLHLSDVVYAYFNVSRDLAVCYPQVPHYPFLRSWRALSPFRICDPVDIASPADLRDIVMTLHGVPFGT